MQRRTLRRPTAGLAALVLGAGAMALAPGWPVAAADQALFDPLWGENDPAAGAWFPQQALQLVQNANPPLL